MSNYLVGDDVRATSRIDRQSSVALGIDNLNMARYWAFHPYTQRTFNAERRFDLRIEIQFFHLNQDAP